jgi:hypothetical protein
MNIRSWLLDLSFEIAILDSSNKQGIQRNGLCILKKNFLFNSIFVFLILIIFFYIAHKHSFDSQKALVRGYTNIVTLEVCI